MSSEIFEAVSTRVPYQHYWDIVGSDVCPLCLDVLNGSAGVADFNNMLIALISKIPSPSWVTKFRLISLSAFLQKVDRDARVKGVLIAPSEPSINHLYFADDNLLFCDPKFYQFEELKRIFRVYETASRQHINFLKYAMSFSPSTHVALQSQL
ncbi:PREDICTED: reverse mRNAase [Prunus dulcis]|uniref:PREDICTED: reverse mRNAase n=1 Tax=Prunus dulcis TaxID=3755 RepID=A0A5E4G1W5_PRUDU|nr:hypothetical protein L3X38_010988 [Prunus dulcis]VVA33663.1 PREDICTED: reverse mRNAase [Prunus dulcis]